MKIHARTLWVSAMLLIVAVVGCKQDDGNGNAEPDGGDDPACDWDAYNSVETAGSLTLGTVATGHLCPYEDEDWYRFSVGSGATLVTVLLVIDAPVSPVDPTYTIWSADGTVNLASPESTEAARPSEPLTITHNLGAGEYLIVVRDTAGDGEDTRHAYQLTVTASSDGDTNEPNNGPAGATAGGTSLETDGYISYRGDEDWYAVTANDRDLVIVNLTMPAGGIQPAFKIVNSDDVELASQSNPGGGREATAMDYVQALATAGTYYVVVYDDDTMNSDGSAPYRIQLSVVPDPDDNETNDTPDDATGLGPQGDSEQAYLASTDDIDWYAVTVGGADLIQVDVDFDNEATLPENLQASIRMVYAPTLVNGGKACTLDQDCQTLDRACDNELDCAGIGNTCLAGGAGCAGAGVCLPGGMCGANIITEWADEWVGGVINPNRDKVSLAAPTFGADTIYVAVQDYHANANSLTHAYDVTLSHLGSDPDGDEPSEVYTAGPPQGDHDNSMHMAMASDITVGGPGSCPGNSTTGYISYTYDQDWFRYAHPCPGEACMLEFHYDFGFGPVDYYVQVYRNGSLWMDNLAGTKDVAADSSDNGIFGRKDEEKEVHYCYYAYNGDGEVSDAGVPEEPFFYYYVNIRDMIYRDINPEGGTWDWSRSQQYSFCIEEVAPGCLSPCVDYGDGDGGVDCGSPVN